MEAHSSSARRWLLLSLCSLACGGLSCIAALLGLLWSLPPTDGAYGMTALEFLSDPLMLYVAAAIAVPASALGLIAARVFLWNTRLEITMPIVGAVSVLVCLACGRFGVFAVVLALSAALLTMIWCQERFPVAGSATRRTRHLRA